MKKRLALLLAVILLVICFNTTALAYVAGAVPCPPSVTCIAINDGKNIFCHMNPSSGYDVWAFIEGVVNPVVAGTYKFQGADYQAGQQYPANCTYYYDDQNNHPYLVQLWNKNYPNMAIDASDSPRKWPDHSYDNAIYCTSNDPLYCLFEKK